MIFWEMGKLGSQDDGMDCRGRGIEGWKKRGEAVRRKKKEWQGAMVQEEEEKEEGCVGECLEEEGVWRRREE